MQYDQVRLEMKSGKMVTISEPDDHTIALTIEGHLRACFTSTGVTIEIIQKEVKPHD